MAIKIKKMSQQQQQSHMVKPTKIGNMSRPQNMSKPMKVGGMSKPKKWTPQKGIPNQAKLKNIGVGWGGEKPKAKSAKQLGKKAGLPSKNKVMSSLRKTMGY